MKKRVKTGTVAFATSSGFAVVQSPSGPAQPGVPRSADSASKVAKSRATLRRRRDSVKAQ